MHPDTTVVVDESKLAKAIHEEAHPRARRSDHLRECLLRYLRNQRLLLPRGAELRHQEQNSRQSLFAGVEELIHQIGLGAHTAGKHKLEEHIRKRVFFMDK